MQITQQYTSILNLIKNCKSISQSYSLLPLIRMFKGTEFSSLIFELRNIQDSICKRDLNKWNNSKTDKVKSFVAYEPPKIQIGDSVIIKEKNYKRIR